MNNNFSMSYKCNVLRVGERVPGMQDYYRQAGRQAWVVDAV